MQPTRSSCSRLPVDDGPRQVGLPGPSSARAGGCVGASAGTVSPTRPTRPWPQGAARPGATPCPSSPTSPAAPTAPRSRPPNWEDFAQARGVPPLVHYPNVRVALGEDRPGAWLLVNGDVMARQSELWANLLSDAGAAGAAQPERLAAAAPHAPERAAEGSFAPLPIGKALPPAIWYAVLAHMHDVVPCTPGPNNFVDVHAAVDFLLPQPGDGGAKLRALRDACLACLHDAPPAALAAAFARALALDHAPMADVMAARLLRPAHQAAAFALTPPALVALLGPAGPCTSAYLRTRLLLGWVTQQCPDETLRPAFVRNLALGRLRDPAFWPPGPLRACGRSWGILPPATEAEKAAEAAATTRAQPPQGQAGLLSGPLRHHAALDLEAGHVPAHRRLHWLADNLLAVPHGPQLDLVATDVGERLQPVSLGTTAGLAAVVEDGAMRCATNDAAVVTYNLVGGDVGDRVVLQQHGQPFAQPIVTTALSATYVAVGGANGALNLFDRDDGSWFAQLPGLRGSVTQLQVAGNHLLSATSLGELRRWDVVRGVAVERADLPQRTPLALWGDAEATICGGVDRSVAVHDRQRPSWGNPRVDPAGYVEAYAAPLANTPRWHYAADGAVLSVAVGRDCVAAAMQQTVVVLDRADGQALRWLAPGDVLPGLSDFNLRFAQLAAADARLAVTLTDTWRDVGSGVLRARSYLVLLQAADGDDAATVPQRRPQPAWRWPWQR